MTAPQPAPAGRPRASRLSASRRAEILGAVVELVERQGYEATTIEQIAARTGASKATLYRRWTDKPTLVVTALRETAAIDLPSIDTGHVVTDLECLMDMLARHAERNVALVLTIAEAGRHHPELRHAFTTVVLPELARLEQIVRAARERGEVSTRIHPEHLIEVLVGALFTGALFRGDARGVDAAHLRGYLRAVILPVLGLSAVS